MIEDADLVYPPDNASIIGIGLKEYQRSLIRGLSGGRSVLFKSAPWIAARSSPIRSELLETAIYSAIKQPKSDLVRSVKRSFLKGQYNWCYRRFSQQTPLIVACWNGTKGYRLLAMEAARALGHATLYLELAPLPGRITVDLLGINYNSSLPHRADFYLTWLDNQGGVDSSAWRQLRVGLKPRTASQRTDVGQQPASENLAGDQYVFCPLQVPGDSQVTIFGDWVPSVEALIGYFAQVSTTLPHGYHLRIKEHPSAKVSFARQLASVAGNRIRVDNETNTLEQVAHAKAVVTINSSVGFESLFFDKPVIVLGHAFYGIEGVAVKAKSLDHLSVLLSAPDSLGFDEKIRNAFMTYVTAVHFPDEASVLAGRITLTDIIARDRARDDVLQEL